MFTMPPLYPTSLTPNEIIGFDNIPSFENFYRIVSSPKNLGEFPEKEVTKAFSKQDRAMMAETLQALRDNGYYPAGFKTDGKIRWKIVLKGKGHMEMEKGLESFLGMSKQECTRLVDEGLATAHICTRAKFIT